MARTLFILVFGIIICFPGISYSQEPYIFSNDPFSGISTVGISPTQTYFSPNSWDVHFFSEDLFLQNRYGFFSKTSLLGLPFGEGTTQSWDYFNYDQTGYHFSSELMGPSFSFATEVWEKYFRVGLFSKLRTQSSIIEIDNYLKFTNQGIDEPPIYNLGPSKMNLANWTEFGLNLSTDFFPYSENFWVLGVNMKYLMGNDAVNIINKDDALMRREYQEDLEDPEIINKLLFVSDFDLEISYATGYNFEKEGYDYKNNGSGWGTDIGIAMAHYEKNSDEYEYKISANLIDLGYINYKGYVHHMMGDNFQYTHNPVLDDEEFENIEQYAQIISNEIYGDPNKSLISNSFKIGLPTSFHLNASKRIGEGQYLNLNWIQRVPIFENSLKRSNILNVSYIKSDYGFGYGASLSLYEYKVFQAGAFLRWGPLVVGSENALSFIIPKPKLNSFDFYIGLKIYPFRNRDIERRSREDCKC